MASATQATDVAAAYAAALGPYLKAQSLLADDKADDVARLLQQSMRALEPVRDVAPISPSFSRLADAAAKANEQPIADLRETFKDISIGLIDIGHRVGLSPAAPAVKVFRCPMKKANWLQTGDETHNPYYGSEMPACGSAIETLPPASPAPPAMPDSGAIVTAPLVLTVPRSAVIDTGEQKIVYVESSPGVYDMHAVKLGPLAEGDLYPVVEGLSDGDRVVTIGTFLVDAENRLNPTRASEQAPSESMGGMKM
jgi:hypothetical protein